MVEVHASRVASVASEAPSHTVRVRVSTTRHIAQIVGLLLDAPVLELEVARPRHDVRPVAVIVESTSDEGFNVLEVAVRVGARLTVVNIILSTDVFK